MSGSQSDDLAAFLAGAEYHILQAQHGTAGEAGESLVSAGCWYAPRLLAATLAALEAHTEFDPPDGFGPPVCRCSGDPWPCPEREAITRRLLGEQ